MVRVTTTLVVAWSWKVVSEGACQEGLVTEKMDAVTTQTVGNVSEGIKNGTTQCVIYTCLGRTREVWRLTLLRIED